MRRLGAKNCRAIACRLQNRRRQTALAFSGSGVNGSLFRG
nr:Hypothetical protein [Aeromonas sp.]